MPLPLRGNYRHTANWCVKYTRNTGVNMSVAICPHCAAVQRQPAEAGSVVQCEACHKSFTVGESVNPAVTQPPVSAPAAPVKHIPTGYGGGILIAKIVAAMGWLFAAAGIFIMLSSIGARYGTAMLVFFYGAGTLLAGMMTVLLAQTCQAVMRNTDYTRTLLERNQNR